MSTGQSPRHKPSGSIGLATRDFVYSEFALNLARLAQRSSFEVVGALNYDLAHARNFMVENFKGDYLLLMDDDHTFPADLAERLVANGKDVCGPLVLARRAPFPTSARKDGKPLDRDAPPGLYEVDYQGGAGMLIHRRVFEAIEPPWFWHGAQNGHSSTHITDDDFFCDKVREAGFKIFCDTTLQMGHLTITNLKPEWVEGNNQWFTRQETDAAMTRYAQEA